MLARRIPFENFFAVQRDLFNLMDRIFGEPWGEWPSRAGFTPRVEAYYKDAHLIVRVELPGVDPKAVDISTAGNTLTIKGERKEPGVTRDDMVIYGDFSYGPFERTVTLPEGLEMERVRARWENGILEVHIPVAEKFLPKKVPVEVSTS